MAPINIAVLVVLVLLLWYAYQSAGTERFDQYRNHDMAVETLYSDMGQIGAPNPDADKELALVAKYRWKERDRLGLTLYDKVYEAQADRESGTLINSDGAALGFDDQYVRRDVNPSADNVYDARFSTLDGDNFFSTYQITPMLDHNPAFAVMNGELVTMAQKNY